MKFSLSIKFFFLVSVIYSQSKVSGIIVDADNNPLSYASISFSNSYKGAISNEDGTFYLESNLTHNKLTVNFLSDQIPNSFISDLLMTKTNCLQASLSWSVKSLEGV